MLVKKNSIYSRENFLLYRKLKSLYSSESFIKYLYSSRESLGKKKNSYIVKKVLAGKLKMPI